jgi:hypothetical protein
MRRKACFVLCLFFSLAAFPVAIQAGPCSSKFNCKDCKDNGVGQYVCRDVKYDSYCKCDTFPMPFIACELKDICDYTGPPPCPHPTPSGECPGGNFGFVSAPLTDTARGVQDKSQVIQDEVRPSSAADNGEAPDEE